MILYKWLNQGILEHKRTCFSSKSLPPKCVDSSSKQYITWKYLDILAQGIIHEDLMQLKNLREFCQFSLYGFLGLIFPDTTQLYTTGSYHFFTYHFIDKAFAQHILTIEPPYHFGISISLWNQSNEEQIN